MRRARNFQAISLGSLYLLLVPAAALRADIVELNDGRRFEGNVLTDDDEKVRIDARVGSVRVIVGFPKRDVKTVEKKPLPPGFFEVSAAAEEAAKAPPGRQARTGEVLYLEIPIRREFGKEVLASGVAAALTHARNRGVQHVVFTVDSEGGDLDEAIEIYRLLQRQRPNFKYHALVKRCQGDALVVPLWCDTVQMVPGGIIGGGHENLAASKKDGDGEEREILWSQVASKVVVDTKKSGRHADLVRALLDPGERFTAWRGQDGKVHTGAAAPADVPPAQVVLKSGEGKTLEITYDQATALTMKPFTGGPEELGKHLNIGAWVPESDYGSQVMLKTATEKQKKDERAQAAYDAKVKKNVSRRQESQEYIENSLKQAAEWDPSKATYDTFSNYYSWGGWGWSENYESQVYTPEARTKWRTRTDASQHFLKEAAKGLKAMKKLDAEAAKLNLDPSYAAGQIDLQLKDIEVRYAALGAQRAGPSGD
jgi:hypothetical protein